MRLRLVLSGFALLASVPAAASDPAGPPPPSPIETDQVRPPAPRVPGRKPAVPLKPRMIEAPGAAWMMIPATWAPAGSDGF